MSTGLDVTFAQTVDVFWVSVHVDSEERKGGVVSHQHAQGGVELRPDPQTRHRPATQLLTERRGGEGGGAG